MRNGVWVAEGCKNLGTVRKSRNNIWKQRQVKVNCLLLKLNRKLRKMFLSPRRESRPQPTDEWWDDHWATRTEMAERRLRCVLVRIRATHVLLIQQSRYVCTYQHRIDTQPEVRLRHFFVPLFHSRHFASKRFWFYEFLFVEIWVVTQHSDSSSTFQS